MKKSVRIINYVWKALLVILFICPFYLAFCYSFKSKEDITFTGLSFPTHLYLDNFTNAFEKTDFLTPLWNTVYATVFGTVILTLVCSMAAYVLARRKGKLYALLGGLLTLSILVPFHGYMLPLYIRLRNWGLINNPIGFSLAKIGAAVGFSVIIMTGFVKSVPIDVEEATYIDGGGVYTTFFLIVLPLMQPILMTSVVINALDIWNEYAMGVIILQKTSSWVLSLLQYTFFGQYYINLGQAFAIFTLSMIPILVLYLTFQRFIISGITMGSVKG